MMMVSSPMGLPSAVRWSGNVMFRQCDAGTGTPGGMPTMGQSTQSAAVSLGSCIAATARRMQRRPRFNIALCTKEAQ